MIRYAKLAAYSLLIVGALFVAYRLYDRQFKQSNITLEWLPADAQNLTAQQSEQLHTIFSQPFDYLDRGKQTYVFASRDGQYVVKFFDAGCRRSGAFPLLISPSKKRCLKKIKRLIEGYQVAMEHDSGHHGIVYMQLEPNPALNQIAVVFDRFGIKHEIDLTAVPFVVQQKAVPLRQLISELLAAGNVEEAKKRFRQVVSMYVESYEAGVYDRDHNVMYNVGFVEGTPIRIDAGRLQYNPEYMDRALYSKDLRKIMDDRFGGWLSRHYPQYRAEIIDDAKASQGGDE